MFGVVLLALGGSPATGVAPSAGVTADLAFHANATAASFGFALSFNATFSVSAPVATPGSSANVVANLTAPTSTNLSVTYFGVRSTIPVAPLGALYDRTIPGLTYTYHGVPLQVELNLSAVVAANATVDGPATGGGAFRWDASGPRTVPIDVASAANASTPVTVVFAPIEYAVSVAVAAVGTLPVVGPISVPLYSGSLGLVPASPPTVAISLPIPSPTPATSPLGADGAAALVVGVAAAAVVGCVVGWTLRRSK